MIWLVLIVGGLATTFDAPAVDKHNRGSHACMLGPRRRARTPQARDLYDRGHLVAHRRAPCWAILRVCLRSNGRCELATVADRGPRHAAIDLFAPLAKALGSSGRETVDVSIAAPLMARVEVHK